MANTYSFISKAEVTAGNTAASLSFTNIPQTFTDLYIQFSGRASNVGGNWAGMELALNGGSVLSQTAQRLYAVPNSSLVSDTPTAGSTGLVNGNGNVANSFGSSGIRICNYTSSNNKSWAVDAVTESNAVGILLFVMGGVVSISAPITRLDFSLGGSFLFGQYSSAYLYGIKRN